MDIKCEHSPNARNICSKCGKEVFYLDLGGPGAGGSWMTGQEYKSIPVANMDNKPWVTKTGDEIVNDLKDALNIGREK